METSEDSELANFDFTALKVKNREEALVLFEKIKFTINSVNTLDLLTKISWIAFYISEEEDVYERGVSFDLRETPIVHLICGLSLQNTDNIEKEEIKANDLYELIDDVYSYLTKTSPLLNDIGSTDDANMVINSHKQTMKMIRPINPERYPFQTESFVHYLDTRISDIYVEKFGIPLVKFVEIGNLISQYTINKVNDLNKRKLEDAIILKFIEDPENDLYFIKTINEKESQEKADEYSLFYIKYLLANFSKSSLYFTFEELNNDTIFEGVSESSLRIYLDLFSCKPGEQLESSDLLLDNILFRTPFININGVYICPAPTDIISSLPTFIEHLLEGDKLANPPTRSWDRFQKAKAGFVEDKAEEYFLRLFPRVAVYKNVLYEFNGNIEEADLLIPYDNKLIVVQAKSGSLNSAAKRGADRAFKNVVKKLIEDAYNQGVKVRDYLHYNPGGVFKLKKNKEVAFSRNPISGEATEYIFINLTLEPLAMLSSRIKDLRSLGFFKSNEYPVSMSIYDLDTITSILPDSPSIFIHYIKNRIVSQEEGLFAFQDELTPFSWYLEYGSLNRPDTVEPEVNFISLDSDYLNKFDDYYLRNGEKPVIALDEEWINLIKHIEGGFTPGFSTITEHLLNMRSEMRERLILKIKECFSKKYKQGVIGIHSLSSNVDIIGVTFVTNDVPTKLLNQMLETYSLLKKYQGRKKYWIGLAKQQKSNGPWWKVTCVQYYDFPWTFDPIFENEPNTFSS